jgi:lysophospholipase L1-like esterase
MKNTHASSKREAVFDDAKNLLGPRQVRRVWTWKLRATGLLILMLVLALMPPLRERLLCRVSGTRGQTASAKIARLLLSARYRFYDVVPAMVWNNGQQFDQALGTTDFLSSIVLSTDSPSLLLFARFDQLGEGGPPRFDISIDGGPTNTVIWRSVLAPQRLFLGATGEHIVVIRANPLRDWEVGNPFSLSQNVITGFAVPTRYRISAKPESRSRHVLVTVTDSIGQGYGTPDPARDAWTARLADSGRWPGNVMNRGSVGARLIDYCNSEVSCTAFADRLDKEYSQAAAYYFVLGTNDFDTLKPCIVPSVFAEYYSTLLRELHRRNLRAALYLQTPLHRADEASPNSCGNKLAEFREAEQRMAETLTWVTLIDGFSQPFPQNASGSSIFVDGVHPTAQGQEQYFRAVLQSLHLGT